MPRHRAARKAARPAFLLHLLALCAHKFLILGTPDDLLPAWPAQTYSLGLRPLDAIDPDAPPGTPVRHSLWIVLQLCNRGALRERWSVVGRVGWPWKCCNGRHSHTCSAKCLLLSPTLLNAISSKLFDVGAMIQLLLPHPSLCLQTRPSCGGASATRLPPTAAQTCSTSC